MRNSLADNPALLPVTTWSDQTPALHGGARLPSRVILETPTDCEGRPDLVSWMEKTHDSMVEALHREAPELARRLDAALEQFPRVGQRFLDFTLVEQLGQGSFGRVYLAAQGGLGNRMVALKIAPDLFDESLNLAQLQHTNIVPIYSVHCLGDLQAICMPYFGRTTVADLCSEVSRLGAMPNSGRALVSTLRSRFGLHATAHESEAESGQAKPTAMNEPAPAVLPSSDALERIAHLSYLDAILWMGARLAEGLHHAHERGILHRDLKPANILLTDDAQPMILDFNLSEDRNADPQLRQVRNGGTIPYMSPEQLDAFQGRPASIDARSDIYALGVILTQLMTGVYPFPLFGGGMSQLIPRILDARHRELPSPRGLNPTISPALEAILLKAIAPEPGDRYQTAEQLAEDLERQRTHQRLKFAREPSAAESLRKWAKRNPKIASWPVALCLSGAVVLTGATVAVGLSLERQKRDYLVRQGQVRERVERFQRLRAESEQYLASSLDNPRLLNRGTALGVRALQELGTLERSDGGVIGADLDLLGPDERIELKNRASELVHLMIGVLPSAERSPAWVELDAELRRLVGGEDHFVSLARDESKDWRTRFDRLKGAISGSSIAPRARFLLAADLQAQGRYRESLELLKEVVRDEPDDASGWFLLGRAHQKLEENREAWRAYGSCIALNPRFAPGYFNRALLSDLEGNFSQALLDLDRAILLDAELVEARLFRAELYRKLKKLDAALAETEAILKGEAPPGRVHFLRAAIHTARGDNEKAAEAIALGLKEKATDSVGLVAQGVARLPDDPRGALSDFREAEKRSPRAIEPIQNQAYVHGELLHDAPAAIECINRLLSLHPDFTMGLVSRGVYLARVGKFDEAVRDAKTALGISDNPQILYRVACVYALAAKGEANYRAEALGLIAECLKRGVGHEYLPTDADLDPLRRDPDFQQLLGYVGKLETLEKLRSELSPRRKETNE